MSHALASAATTGDARPGGPPAIELRGLTKTFGKGKNEIVAVKPVSLVIQPGQVFGLLGPNGAGKTTTIKMIAGLLAPTDGTALINGYDIQRQRSQAVRHLGAVLEGSRNVYWSLTAMQNLLYFGRLKGLRTSDIKSRGEQLLQELDLWERRDQQVGGFSRGMQQKVAVAAALVTDPPVVLLDEPTIGLDIEAARTVREWVIRLARQEGKTIVLTTHQLDMAEELCDRVAVIRRGEIITDLPTNELCNRYAENRYEVRVAVDTLPAGVVDDGSEVTVEDGQTSILLPTEDQQALHALLARLGAAQVPVTSVNQVQPSLEEVFVRLVQEGQR